MEYTTVIQVNADRSVTVGDVKEYLEGTVGLARVPEEVVPGRKLEGAGLGIFYFCGGNALVLKNLIDSSSSSERISDLEGKEGFMELSSQQVSGIRHHCQREGESYDSYIQRVVD